MRKRSSILLAMSLLLLLVAIQAGRSLPLRETYYTVRYTCNVSPPPPPGADLVGEWTLHCDGTMTGWGWEPGHNCSTTYTSYGEWCPTGGDSGDPRNRN